MTEEVQGEEVEAVEDAQPTFTQDQVDKMIRDRLARQQKQFEKKTAGVDLDEARKLIEEREQLELERQKERGDFDNILKQFAEKKDAEIAQLKTRLHENLVDGALFSAASASNAVNSEQVVALLKNRVKLNDDGNVDVLDSTGSVSYSADGNQTTVKDLVNDFLAANPHFVRATQGGAGSKGSAGGSGLPMSTPQQDIDNWSNGGREAFAARMGLKRQ